MNLRNLNIKRIRTFMNGYYWYFGLRLAFAVLLPSIVLYEWGILDAYLFIPLGTLNLGLTDVIGSLQRRLGALFIGTASFFICALLAGLVRDIWWLELLVLLIIAFVFSLLAVYGTRMMNVGSLSIIVAIYFMDKHLVPSHIFYHTLYLAAGCLIYIVVLLVSYKLRPYKLIQQMLGEHIVEVSKFLQLRSEFYARNADEKQLMDKNIAEQIALRGQQENLREIILKMDVSAEKSSYKIRGLLMMFLDTIDMFELIMTSHQDYKKLHQSFDSTHMLTYIKNYIAMLADELQNIGWSVQAGKSIHPKRDWDVLFDKCQKTFYRLRHDKMNSENLEEFIVLRQIIYILQHLTERLKKLYSDVAFNKDVAQAFHSDTKEYESFVPQQHYGWRYLFDNLSFKSGMFRHAMRVVIALFIGWCVGRILMHYNIGHIYWILMTIVIVLKPAYSQSRRRNVDRLLGTILGGGISLLIAMYVHNASVLFVVICVALLITCTFSKINYWFYTFGITVLVVLSYNYLAPASLDSALIERLMNSLIGIVIGYVISLTVFPNWEKQNIPHSLNDILIESKNYFVSIANLFIGESYNAVNIRLSRRNMLIALANLSDNFQRMMSDPKRRRQNVQSLFRIVSINHTLASYIVSLAQYAKDFHRQYPTDCFSSSISLIENNFDTTLKMLHHEAENNQLIKSLPYDKNLEEQMQNAKMQLRNISNNSNKEKSLSIRKTVTDFRTVHELFELINTSVCDEGKVINGLHFNFSKKKK